MFCILPTNIITAILQLKPLNLGTESQAEATSSRTPNLIDYPIDYP